MSEDIKRYDCTNGKAQHCYGCYQMEEATDGDWVDSADYDTAISQLAALRKELADLNRKFDMVCADADSLQQRLADAERRNVVVAELLQRVVKPFGHRDFETKNLIEEYLETLNPKPEAAIQ